MTTAALESIKPIVERLSRAEKLKLLGLLVEQLRTHDPSEDEIDAILKDVRTEWLKEIDAIAAGQDVP